MQTHTINTQVHEPLKKKYNVKVSIDPILQHLLNNSNKISFYLSLVFFHHLLAPCLHTFSSHTHMLTHLILFQGEVTSSSPCILHHLSLTTTRPAPNTHPHTHTSLKHTAHHPLSCDEDTLLHCWRWVNVYVCATVMMMTVMVEVIKRLTWRDF